MTRWTTEPDGWQVDGRGNYRRLAYDNGKPFYQGAARRYAEVWQIRGNVYSKSAAGYVRSHASVEEAKDYFSGLIPQI
jgi:hypothetical protein